MGEVQQVGNIVDDTNIGFKNPQRGRIYSSNGISPALNTKPGGGLEPKIVCHPDRMEDDSLPTKLVCACLTPSRIEKRQNGRRFKDNEEPMFTLTNQDIHGIAEVDEMSLRIRKLTPKECMRLQGVSDETTDKLIAAGVSDTRLYFAAGDAVTVNVVYEVAKKMKDVMDARDAKENI